jgi:16S rRNA processing protein RimM
MVAVGRIGKPHGLRGVLKVQPATDFPDVRFQPGARAYASPPAADGGVRPRALTVRSASGHLGGLLVAFEEVGGIDEAEELGGCELRIPRDELMALPPGSFYHHDLIGCEVMTVSGERVGTVSAVEESGGARLVVAGPRGDVLVPLAEDICVGIDIGARRVVVAPPEGLLDLNVRGRP